MDQPALARCSRCKTDTSTSAASPARVSTYVHRKWWRWKDFDCEIKCLVFESLIFNNYVVITMLSNMYQVAQYVYNPSLALRDKSELKGQLLKQL